MTKIVFDVPEEFRGLVETWRETLDSMKVTMDRTGGGKACMCRWRPAVICRCSALERESRHPE